MKVKLTTKNKKLMKSSKVRKWLEDCARIVNENLHKELPADAWAEMGGLSDYVAPSPANFKGAK